MPTARFGTMTSLCCAFSVGLAMNAFADGRISLEPSKGRVTEVAHIYYNMLSGDKIVTLHSGQQTEVVASNVDSNSLWSSRTKNPCGVQDGSSEYDLIVENYSLFTDPTTGVEIIESSGNQAEGVVSMPDGNGCFIPRADSQMQIFGSGFVTGEPCNPADFVEPFTVLNFFDVSAFLNAFNAHNPAADFAEPFGVFNFFDVSSFLFFYRNGCH